MGKKSKRKDGQQAQALGSDVLTDLLRHLDVSTGDAGDRVRAEAKAAARENLFGKLDPRERSIFDAMRRRYAELLRRSTDMELNERDVLGDGDQVRKTKKKTFQIPWRAVVV